MIAAMVEIALDLNQQLTCVVKNLVLQNIWAPVLFEFLV